MLTICNFSLSGAALLYALGYINGAGKAGHHFVGVELNVLCQRSPVIVQPVKYLGGAVG